MVWVRETQQTGLHHSALPLPFPLQAARKDKPGGASSPQLAASTTTSTRGSERKKMTSTK